MKSPTKECDDCDTEQMDMGVSLKEKMWGHLLSEKTILINSDIDESLIEKAVMQIYAFNRIDDDNQIAAGKNEYIREPIKVYINTNGGCIDPAFSFISAVQTSRTPVITIALGTCASAGFLMLLAGHIRFMQPHTFLMHHQGSAGYIGKFADIVEYSRHWEYCQLKIDQYVLKQTKIKKKKLQEIFSHKQDWYITLDEAILLGIVNDVWVG